jgi:hypothetical protein
VTGAAATPAPTRGVEPGRPLARGRDAPGAPTAASVCVTDEEPPQRTDVANETALLGKELVGRVGLQLLSDTAFANIDSWELRQTGSATKTGISRSVFSW